MTAVWCTSVGITPENPPFGPQIYCRPMNVGVGGRVKRGVATRYAHRARGKREIELSSTAAGEEAVGDEGDQRHEHDRPE